MSLTAIAAALGLAETADEAACLAAIDTLGKTQTAVAAALALDQTADGDAIVAAAAAAVTASKATAPDPAKFVPVAMFKDVQDRVATLSAARNDELIASATAAGKIAPADASQKWARDYLEQHGEPAFAAFIDQQPVLVAPGGRVGGQPPKGQPVFDDSDASICAMMGLDKETYLANREQEA